MSSAASANYYRGNILYIDEGVEIFRAGQIRKVDEFISHLRDFASHFFSRPQVQLHTFTGTALKDTGDARISLRAGFVLGQRGGAGYGSNDQTTSDRVFIIRLFCVICTPLASK